MAEPIVLPIETDPDHLAEIAFAYLRTVLGEQWEPAEGNLDTWLIRATARIIAEARDVAADVPPAILRWYGASVMRIPPHAATFATARATVRMRDPAGYTVPAGLQVLVRTAGDEGVPFVVAEPLTVPPGEPPVSRPGELQLRAMTAGTDGNGFDRGNAVELLQALEFIESIELTDARSSGGQDAESDTAYIERLIEELALAAPRPILPRDFAVLARRVPEVARALALDGLDPGDPERGIPSTTGNERMVTVAVVDANGDAVPDAHRRVQDLLEDMRELNFRVPVIRPQYTAIDVDFDAIAWPGETTTAVRSSAIAALHEYLSPRSWGDPPGGERPDWIDEPLVRYLEVAEVLQRVPGLRYVTRLGIAREGQTPSTADVRLTGPAGLPRPGANIDGTVTEA